MFARRDPKSPSGIILLDYLASPDLCIYFSLPVNVRQMVLPVYRLHRDVDLEFCANSAIASGIDTLYLITFNDCIHHRRDDVQCLTLIRCDVVIVYLQLVTVAVGIEGDAHCIHRSIGIFHIAGHRYDSAILDDCCCLKMIPLLIT